MPISCSLARNAPLRSFVGLLWVLCGPLRVLCGPLRYLVIRRTVYGNSKGFEVKVGMHQGSGLSPLLFVIVMEAKKLDGGAIAGSLVL